MTKDAIVLTMPTPALTGAEETMFLAPYFLARVTGLPFTALDKLQCPQTAAIIEEILAIEARQGQQRDQLTEALRKHSEQFIDSPLQHKCLDLRRAIAGQNGKKAHKLLQALAEHLPEALAAELAAWCISAIRRTDLLAAGESTLQTELIACREALRQLLRDDDFQRGLLLSSTTLYTELQHYLSAPAYKMNNRLRRAEEGLLSYLLRTAAKTSPYSTFTSTALGSWRDRDTQPARVDIQDWRKTSVIRFHDGIIAGIIRALSQRPEVRPYLPPMLNTTIRREGEKIAFFVSDKVVPFAVGHFRERLIRLRPTPLTRAILDTIEQHGNALTYQEIAARVSSATGTPAQEVTEAIEHLANRAALYISLPVPDHEDDKLGAIIHQLATIPGEWVAGIRTAYEHIYRLAQACATAPAAERHHLLAEIQQRTRELSYTIGHLQNEANEEIDKRFRNLVLEDTLLSPEQLTLNRAALHPLLADLQVLQQLTPILDEATMHRLILSCFFEKALYLDPQNEASDFIDLYMRLSAMREERAYTNGSATHLPQTADASSATTPPSNQSTSLANMDLQAILPQVAQLIEMRRRFTTLVREHVEQARTHKASRLVLDPAEIRRFTASFPDSWERHYSLAYFGQLFREDGRDQMVVNLSWPGPGPAFSRFSYLLKHTDGTPAEPTLTDMIRAYVTELGHKRGGIYASIVETAGINVNIRGALTPLEIIYPSSISARLVEELIPLRDIQVSLDSRTRRVQFHSQRLGMPIYPLHMGYSLLYHMPPLYQMLIFPDQHYVEFDLISRIEGQLSPAEKTQVRYYPRISVGHAVLARECWKIPQHLLPQREAGETDFAYFLKVNRWRSALGLPLEGFSRISSRLDRTALRLEAQLEGIIGMHHTPAEGSDTVAETPSSPPGSSLSSQTAPANELAEHQPPDSAADGKFAFLARLTENDTVRKPLYVNFHNYLSLILFEQAIEAVEREQSLTFQEMLPTRSQHLLHRGTDSYATEFIIELSS
jgi:hypothetical protein